jgi:lipoprotein-releasing system permease protein
LLIGTVLGTALIGFLASIVPARRAANVDPIEVIQDG